MKRKNIRNIMGLLFSFAFINISCMDDITDRGIEHTPAPDGECYFSIKIKAGDLLSFSRANNGYASKEELVVHSVRVVLYDGNEEEASKCKVEYVFEFRLKTSDSWNDTADPANWIVDEGDHKGEVQPGYIIPSGSHLSPTTSHDKYEFVTFAQRVKDKPYKMLVIINGQDAKGSFASEIYKATNKGSFLYQLRQAASVGLNTSNGTLQDGKGILMTNHQGLVPVAKGQLGKTIHEAHASPVQASVDRLVAKVTLRHADTIKLPDGIDGNSVTWGLDVTNKKTFWMRESTPGEKQDPTMETLYARDPNYAVFSSGVNTSGEFNTSYTGYYLPSGRVSGSLGEYLYTFENTIETGNNEFTAYGDQITRVVVGYKYTPKGFSKGDSFYIYKNKVLSQAEINSYLNDPLFEIPGLDGLRIILDELKQKNYPVDGTGSDYYETKGFRYCPGGQIYFLIPIQHFNVKAEDLGYYGVVRNNIYEITINSLNPPDLAGPYLSADISIQPWALYGQTNTIGVSLTERTYAPLRVYYWGIKDNTNLYRNEWAKETGRPVSEAPEYRTMMFPVGTTVRPTQCVINWTPVYFYTHSIPELLTMSDNIDDNEMHLFYWNGSVSGSPNPVITVYFADQNGQLLDVRYKAGGYQPNPFKIAMYPIEENGKGYVYIRYLGNVHNFYYNGIEYEIRDNDYVAYLGKELSNEKIEFGAPYYEEPVWAASLTSGVWSADKVLVILCEPK